MASGAAIIAIGLIMCPVVAGHRIESNRRANSIGSSYQYPLSRLFAGKDTRAICRFAMLRDVANGKLFSLQLLHNFLKRRAGWLGPLNLNPARKFAIAVEEFGDLRPLRQTARDVCIAAGTRFIIEVVLYVFEYGGNTRSKFLT